MSAVVSADAFNALVILHGEGGQWIPQATTRNFATGKICATVSTLSPFVVARLNVSYQVQPLFDTTKAFKAGGDRPDQVAAAGLGRGQCLGLWNHGECQTVEARVFNTSFVVQDAGNANEDGRFPL